MPRHLVSSSSPNTFIHVFRKNYGMAKADKEADAVKGIHSAFLAQHDQCNVYATGCRDEQSEWLDL